MAFIAISSLLALGPLRSVQAESSRSEHPHGGEEPADSSSSRASSVVALDTTALAGLNGSVGLRHKLLWYIPNRIMDLVDVFRFRIRGGPGLAANVRVTDYANVYAGRYNTAYIGLPGPRMSPNPRLPLGLEQERGLILMGVDATDDLEHEPQYSPTEFIAGIQALIIGVEAGMDPVELGDFLAGFILINLREDDH